MRAINDRKIQHIRVINEDSEVDRRKFYFDEIYAFLFVRPAQWIGRFLWKRGDGTVIDGTINEVALGFVPWMTRLAGRAQSGYLFHYAFAMVIGIVVLTLWLGLRSAG